MKVTALLYTLMAATAVSAAAVAEPNPLGGLEARDTCGSGYNVDQRRTNSGCKAGNGDRHFCGCDRTGVVECKGGKWTEVQDCGRSSCKGTANGGATC
ncbi:unnamed protein product [Penicillium salamii]|uniref:Bubble protein n=1 Tax=Penicillium salamii TaxID=1612424 RepID=A0A9W4NKT4_9EURO|nr:unnamed protein product [Penicillium salamii]